MKYKPHEYQSYATDFILTHPVAAILLSMGLGKSVITLTAIHELCLNRFEISRVLVIAPLRVARNTWPEEIEKWEHLNGLTYSVAVGTAAERRTALVQPTHIHIINRENVQWLIEESGLPFNYDMVVIDELSSFKSYQAKRFRSLMKVRPLVRRIVGLTGTPSSNGLMDLWAEFRVLDMGKRLGRFITHYRDEFFLPDKRSAQQVFTYKPKPGAEAEIYRRIDWASITTLTAAFTAIANASIGTADIDWAHIKDLATDTAIITQGVGGKLYIADLAVTEANMVSLTVGELIVKGTDGGFYAVNVDGEGNIVSTRKQVGNADVGDASINAGEKLIEGTVTAACLNVNDIFANNAIIRNLIAANIDVDTLFAREATIAALNAADITGNEYLRLMVAGKADAADVNALGQRMSAAELKITDSAIVSTVTSSSAYQQAQQQIYSDMDTLLGYRLEIKAGTVFLTENVRSTTLTAHVWHGNTEVTDTIESARFRWFRESDDTMADAVWNDAHQRLKSVLVSTADVLRQASFRCELYSP